MQFLPTVSFDQMWISISCPWLFNVCSCMLHDILESGPVSRFWCTIVRSFQRADPTMLKNIFMWFQWFIVSELWPNNTVNTKFCVKWFLGAHISQPPQNALYHTVQMVLVDPCDKFNFSLLIAQLWPIMTQDDWLWSGMTYHGQGGARVPREGPRGH